MSITSSTTDEYTFSDGDSLIEENPNTDLDEKAEFENVVEGSRAAELIGKCNATTIAGVFAELSPPERIELFKELRPSSRTLLLLRPSEQGVVLDQLSLEECSKALQGLSSSERINLFQTLPEAAVEKLRPLITTEELSELEYYLSFAEDSLGRSMKSISLLPLIRAEWTLNQVQDYVQNKYEGNLLDNGAHLFVIGSGNKLLGTLKPQVLLSNEDLNKVRVSEVMDTSFFSLSVDAKPKDYIIPLQQMSDIEVIPLLNDEQVLCGFVALNDIVRYADDIGRKDLQQLFSLEPLEVSYSNTSFKVLLRKRVVWLVVLVLLNLASTFVIGAFEAVLAENIALSYFIPLLVGTGGNVGAQSATLLITSLNTKDVSMKDWKFVWMTEAILGALLGILLACGVWIMAFVRDGVIFAFAVSLSMWTIVFFATNMGVFLPFIAILCKQDPIVASSPLITSLLDLSGIALYFGIATAILGI